MRHRSRGSDRSRRLARAIGVGAVAVLGLLLWARLKLVTDTPRMVYADPPIEAPRPAEPAPDADAGR